ncbi:MAG TPA: hypothetical protein VFG10_12510 [Saprospiraceae bacterium]|nr:hypothetical protein [Saprospiraceae bacterium]
MNALVVYIFYIILSLWITIRVGNSLHKYGRPWIIYLIGEENLSDKVNDMLLLGYRLVNIGYILFTLMNGKPTLENMQSVIEFLSIKLGMIITLLAYLHYQNILMLYIFSKLKHKYKWQL